MKGKEKSIFVSDTDRHDIYIILITKISSAIFDEQVPTGGGGCILFHFFWKSTNDGVTTVVKWFQKDIVNISPHLTQFFEPAKFSKIVKKSNEKLESRLKWFKKKREKN